MSQKPHLDDFFAAARREEPVVSHEEIGELINARHTTSPLTQHITWKGIGMTTVGFGLAAVLSYFTFFASEEPVTSSPEPQIQAATTAPEIKTLVTPMVSPTEPVAVVEPVEPVAPVEPITPIRVEAPIKVDEVRITEPDQSDMKRLGMKVDGGREVVVVQKVGKKFFVVSFGAKPFRVSSELETENPTDIEPTNVLPVFVTNLDGTGVLTAAAPNENTSIITKEVHSSDEHGNSHERTVERTQTNITVHHDDEHANVDVSTDISIDASPVIIDKSNFSFTIDGDSTIAAFANDGKAVGKSRILLKRGNDDISIDMSSGTSDPKEIEKLKKELRIVINDDKESHAININGLDSIHKKVIVARMHADSLHLDGEQMAKEMKQLKEHLAKMSKDIKIRLNDSTLRLNMEQMMKELGNAKAELADAKKKHKIAIINGGPKVRMRANAFNVPGFGELKAQINDLVPMRVALNDDKGRGLIFWYQPSDAPQAVAKQEPAAVAASGTIENITVNPNPAQNHTTVRFTMNDAHAVTISVHDIMGKRLLEAGQVSAGSGGEFTREIDLSSLTQGVYLIVLTADNGEQRIERVLVNK